MPQRPSPRGCLAAAALVLLASAGCGNRIDAPADRRADDTAAYLAGLAVSETSPLHRLTLPREYRNYRIRTDAAWCFYREGVLERMRRWCGRHVRPGSYDRVFYPFSGPDIITPLEFFPDAEEYIMVGLEPPGRLTDPRELGWRRVMAELRAMQYSLHTLMKLNYFRTFEMRREMDPVGFNNIASIMMFFIKRCGLRVTGVRRVQLDAAGNLRDSAAGAAGAVRGIEISFEKADGSRRRKACYLRGDLSNAGLRRSPLMRYLERQGRIVTFMKSAGYLPSFAGFSAIREFILSRSDYIVQDDAGIPIRYLDERCWRTSFYGSYRTLRQFRRYHQPDLGRKMAEQNGGPLDFCYGYGYTPQESHIITARRR